MTWLCRAVAALCQSYGLPQARAEELAIAGTPAEVADRLEEYAGVEHFVALSNHTPWPEFCDLLAATRRRLRASRPATAGDRIGSPSAGAGPRSVPSRRTRMPPRKPDGA